MIKNKHFLYEVIYKMDDMITSFKEVKETGEREKNEPLIQILRWIDTIHDFYPVNATARGENIREIISRQYDSGFKGDFDERENNGINNFLRKLKIEKSTITPTTVEVGTEDYYNTNFKTITVGKQATDVQEIIKNYGTKTAADVLEQYGISADLKLCLTERDFFKENTKQTNFLADVILTFFLGENKNRDVYFLIDAAYGRLDCMFQKIDQASTLINVLTIGDSAVTSVEDKTSKGKSKWCGVEDYQNKFKRKVYLQDPDTIPYTNGNRYDITSNEFTKGKFEMWYQDAALPFSKQNNASARLYVKKKGTGQEWFSEFSILASGSPNSGTSVGTLKQLILAINNNNRATAKTEIAKIYKYETQFNLTPILCGMLDEEDISKDEIIRFLYDYKRAGDHEQANSANHLYKKGLNVILLTGDRLCSLYARLINQPCIYVHDGNYDMYRYLQDVSKEQKDEQAKKLLETRRTFILTEIGKVKPDIIDRLTGLEKHINSLITTLKDTFEDHLYAFIFASLLIKIKNLKEKRLAYASEQKKLQDDIAGLEPGEEAANVEATVQELNEKYNEFYKKHKELFDFALYPVDELEEKKDKFNSTALDYDSKIVKNILNYFNQFSKKNIVSGVYRDGPLAVKKNLVRRIGGAEYKIVLDDLIHYLKKCNAYKGETEAEMVLSDAPQLKERIEILVGEKNFGDHVYDTYKPIFDEIKEFISKKIGKKAEEEGESANEPADKTLPEELAELEKQIQENEQERLNLMKISLYDWFKQKNQDAELPEIEEIYKQRDPLEKDIPWTEKIAAERKKEQLKEEEKLKEKITELDATIEKNQFTEILNSKLEDEYHIFYDAVESPEDDVVPMMAMDLTGGARIMESDYIKNLLNTYYGNIQIKHYQELVDVYLSVTEDTEAEKKGKIGRIYNYITDLYPENVYDYLYKGFAENTVKVNKRKSSSVQVVSVEEGPSTKRRSAAKSKYRNFVVPDALMEMDEESSTDPDIEMINLEPAVTKRKRSSGDSPSDYTTNMKKTKGSRVPTMGKSRKLILSNSDFSVPVSAGGKGTRKYKNKRNKKTRQQRKKTRKNKTLKVKREKGKRTRRKSI